MAEDHRGKVIATMIFVAGLFICFWIDARHRAADYRAMLIRSLALNERLLDRSERVVDAAGGVERACVGALPTCADAGEETRLCRTQVGVLVEAARGVGGDGNDR